ncbi:MULTISPECIES: threonine/serine exporter family protein [Shewanella]|uniref:Threonine/serine exporter family protein n=1 Tax=Shewanella fidelis TaxID=173509 RepID=A0AAW8NP09_9GAMM|nr:MULTISPECIES: threonine/serine exporter family protein [Shewanella]MDR8524969.1 threonine/serine exporter family protein [Shewanella fidelis]MDW4811040.1 threonine/serine exporter family protein [Shewanella fidelis]MDW4815181.1 threonine/serine exporter family protein [Shewanella fidelis]MDW4819271.1 threonine/serine exporter family protein [Shewanella fidelis]MDW4823051.1 threonine/serine exporter family protein [Shewanella fidelis]
MYATTQNDITRQVVRVAQLLLAYGAESELVEEITQRLGHALGLESVEISISSNSLVLTSLSAGRCITTTRRIREHGINMTVVCELQRICLLTEKGIYGLNEVRKRVGRIQAKTYPAKYVVPMIGLSCASFCHLFGGDLNACVITFLASATGMFVRLAIAKRHYNLLLNFSVTAFVTTLIAQTGYQFDWTDTPKLPMAASVLMLVPGFPMINSISDMVKGHLNVGISRWGHATLLTVASVIGITIAMQIGGLFL